MIKKLVTWLTGIIRAELERTEQKLASDSESLRKEVLGKITDVSDEIHLHLTKAAADLRTDAAKAKTDLSEAAAYLTAHVTQEVEKPTEALKAHISAEISSQFEKILAAAAVAAKTSLSDARKALRMPCNFCSKMSWMFTVLEKDGRILCNDCKLKGLGK